MVTNQRWSIGEILKRWGEKDRTPLASTGIFSLFLGVQKGLEIVYTNDKHVVVPGLTGKLAS